jgi:hypothetical protein
VRATPGARTAGSAGRRSLVQDIDVGTTPLLDVFGLTIERLADWFVAAANVVLRSDFAQAFAFSFAKGCTPSTLDNMQARCRAGSSLISGFLAHASLFR